MMPSDFPVSIITLS